MRKLFVFVLIFVSAFSFGQEPFKFRGYFWGTDPQIVSRDQPNNSTIGIPFDNEDRLIESYTSKGVIYPTYRRGLHYMSQSVAGYDADVYFYFFGGLHDRGLQKAEYKINIDGNTWGIPASYIELHYERIVNPNSYIGVYGDLQEKLISIYGNPVSKEDVAVLIVNPKIPDLPLGSDSNLVLKNLQEKEQYDTNIKNAVSLLTRNAPYTTNWNINGTTIELRLSHSRGRNLITDTLVDSWYLYIIYKSPRYYTLLEEAINEKSMSTEGL